MLPDSIELVVVTPEKQLLREKTVEGLLAGRTLGGSLADEVVARALANAAPLKYNAMKIEMAKGLLASGLAALSA